MKTVFGGAIAIVLLGVYVHLLRVAYLIIDCEAITACTTHKVSDFNEVMAQTLNVISGLVSALVIAELAVTKPGEAPVTRVLSDSASRLSRSILNAVTVAYVLVWLVSGLAAFLKGMYHPSVLPPLTSVGQAWLGLAVASAYAYFGIKPQ
ncbi:MAG: hypothetical protein IT434_17760 [Phycisphaerales bacterium]|nr:hypothetical protein [Phycisphaerales bacterium]